MSLCQNTVTEPTSSARNYFAISEVIKCALCVCVYTRGREGEWRKAGAALLALS